MLQARGQQLAYAPPLMADTARQQTHIRQRTKWTMA